MKTKYTLFIILLSIVFMSCTSTSNDKLYNATWELEYASGPRIAFDGLFPNKKPQIAFNETTKRVQGNDSCNGYSADFTIEGDLISFGEPGPTTLMFCGNGEKVFLNLMKKINKYSFDSDGKLNLMIDDVPMLRFHNIQK